jgi:hypothetical protein
MTLQTEERILYCGTDNELYYIIIDKISTDNPLKANSTKYKINLCNKHIYYVDHIYDVGQNFVKYVKIIIDLLNQNQNQNQNQNNKFDLLFCNLMLLNRTNVEESKKILKYLKINDLRECNSNLLDTYLYNKIVAKCNFKKNNFILTNNILDKIKHEYEINDVI